MSHPIVHIEFSANDHTELGKFYSEVFGWHIDEFPEMNYTTFTGPDGTVGGGFNNISAENPAGRIMIYIHSDDLEESLKAIEKHGGKVFERGFVIPTVGTMAVFEDPSGNLVSLLKPEMPG